MPHSELSFADGLCWDSVQGSRAGVDIPKAGMGIPKAGIDIPKAGVTPSDLGSHSHCFPVPLHPGLAPDSKAGLKPKELHQHHPLCCAQPWP